MTVINFKARNKRACPVSLYDMPMRVIENDCSPLRYAIDQHREGMREPVAMLPDVVDGQPA